MAEQPVKKKVPADWVKYVDKKVRDAEASGRITQDDLEVRINARSHPNKSR